MAAKCNIEFNGAFYKSEEEFNDAVLKYHDGKRSEFKNEQDYIVSVLKSLGKNFTFTEADHKYVYNKTGEEFTSTTTKVAEYFNEHIDQSPIGDYSRFVGNNYHMVCEAILNGRAEGKSMEESLDLEFSFTWDLLNGGATEKFNVKDLVQHPVYKEIAEWIDNKYNEWTADGSVVISEFVLGNVATKTAGTVDVAIVHPDGSVTIKDFKGTKDKYGKHQSKLRHNNFQLNMYRAMKMIGDPDLGMPQLKVRDAEVIPIEHDIKTDEQGNFSLQSANIIGEISIDNTEVFKDGDKFKSLSRSNFSPEVLSTSLKVDGKIDFGGDINNLTGHTSMGGNMNVSKIARKKLGHSFKGKDGVYRYYGLNNAEVPFKNKVAATDDSERGEEARQKELEDHVVPQMMSDEASYGKSVIDAFYHGLNVPDTEYDLRKNKTIRSLLSKYTKGADHLVLANTIPGLENVDGNTIIVYRNYDKFTGEYSSVDFLTVDSNKRDLKQFPMDGSDSKNIFGNLMSDNEYSTYAQKAKVAGGTVYNNSKKHNDILKMGLIAMALKKQNPNLRVGDVRSVSVNGLERSATNTISFSGSMRTVLEHFKVLNETKDTKGGARLFEKLSPEVQSLLGDAELMRESNYYQDEVENYLVNALEILGSDFDNMNELTEVQKEEMKIRQTQLRKWRYQNMTDLLTNNADRDSVKALVTEVKQNHNSKRELIQALGERMKQIKALADDSSVSALSQNSEVEMLAKSIAQLNGITTTIDSIKDIGYIERFGASGGITGNELIDSFADRTTEVHNELERNLVNGYMKDKFKKFEEFYGKKLGENLTGTHTRHFENLMEENEYVVNGKKITRKTGKFKDLNDSSLSERDVEFIKWFDGMVQEYFAKLGKYWPQGYIPMVKATPNNIVYKAARRIGKGQQGGFMNTFKSILKRKKEAHDTIQDEHFDADYDTTIDKITTMFEKQGLKDESGNMADFDEYRYDKLGMDEFGNPISGTEKGDMMETNLERVLDMLVITTEAKQAFEPLLPLYDSVKIMIASAKHQTTQKLMNIDEYLRVYTEATLHNKRQQLFKNSTLEAVISGASGFTSAIAIGWNIRSGMKNFLAGYLHNNANHMAALFAGDRKTHVNYAKAIQASWELCNASKSRESNKVHMIMDMMAMHDADVENLKNDKRFKAGGNHLFSTRNAHWMNYAGDYMHRSVMAISKLIADGSWDAFVLKEDADGNERYVYDEDLDMRFKGEKGEALKVAIKKNLAEFGGLDEDGKMKIPWSTQEILKVQKESDITYQTQGLANHATYKQYAVGRAGLQMMSWLSSKRERYWKEGHRNKRLGQWVPYKDSDGNTQYEWQGVYVEGIAQTVKGMYAALSRQITRKEKGAFKNFMKGRSDHQKKNLGYLTNDIAIAMLLMAAVAAVFDDEEMKKTFLYKLLMGTVSEIWVADYAEAAGKSVSSPFPSISIVMNQIEGVLSFDPERMAYSAGRMMGPLKLIEQGGMVLDDIEFYSK